MVAAVAFWLVASPAASVPILPPGTTGWSPWVDDVAVVARCPLHWYPGEPVALFPHPPASTAESGSRLTEASGHAAGRLARGWVEVGRPERALRAIAEAPPTPERRLYRLAALAGLERWTALEGVLEDTPPASLPPGCAPLRHRWEARAVAGRDPVAADRAWERLARALPALGAYVDVWRLEAAARTGDPARGLAAWRRVAESGLPDPVVRDAETALARLHARSGQPELARRRYLAVARETRGPRRAELWLLAAEQAELAGDRVGADRLRARVVTEAPASAADLVLDSRTRARLEIPALEAARVLLAADRTEAAERFATAAAESGSETREKDALLLRAEIRAARGDREGAELDYAAFLARWPSDSRVPEALYDRARLALRFDDGATARRRFGNLVSRFPGHARADDALYLIADSYQDDRRDDPAHADRAIETFDRVVSDHPGSYFSDRAYMRAAHLNWALGRYAESARRYRSYGGRESEREARYWLARSLDRLGERDRARAILESLASTGGGEYYALLARRRLGRGEERVVFDHEGYRSAPLPRSGGFGAELLEHPSGRTAAALLALGEREYARAELERAVARLAGDRSRLAAWAPALSAWGFPDLTLRIGVRLGGEDHPFAWPAGFAEALGREAEAHRLDVFYLLALVRQESLFRSHVVSPADARGLMQIIPPTGREIAEATGWEAFDEAVLFDPAVNLHFGSRYLADQLARFGGFWPAVLSAYNAGPPAVAKWWDFPERTLDPELWVERIPYRETRNYVKRIVAQYVRYQRLHGSGSAGDR